MNGKDDQLKALFAYLDGELAPEEAARFEARMASDPELKARHEEVSRYFGVLGRVRREQGESDASWSGLDRRIDEAIANRSEDSFWSFFRLPARLLVPAGAAALVVLLAIGFYRWTDRENSDVPLDNAPSVNVVAQPSESPVKRSRLLKRAPSFPVVTVALLQGRVTLVDGDLRRSVTSGQQLVVRNGQRFVVDAGGRLRVQLGQHRVTVAQRSALTVVAHGDKLTHLRLERGSVVSEVARRKPGELFRVDAKEYKVSVRGTVFGVSIHPRTQRVKVEVTRGRVAVQRADETDPEKLLNAGVGGMFVSDASPQQRLADNQRKRPNKRRVVNRKPAPELTRPVKVRPRRQPVKRPGNQQPELLIQVPTQQMKQPKVVNKPAPKPGPAVIPPVLIRAIRLAGRNQYQASIALLKPFLTRRGQAYRSDALYVVGYCYHKLGQKKAARTYLKAYHRSARKGRWLQKAGDFFNPPRPTLRRLRGQ